VNAFFQNVLLVDDDPGMLASLSHILKSAGFRVRAATNGAEALQAVRQECPYFIITDWMMSPMDGIEFCHQLRRENLPHYTYVVLLTVKDQADDTVTGLNAGADDFITKPVGEGELLARLQAGSRVLELENRMKQYARIDPLTGALNCRAFHQLLELEWNRAIRYRHHLSCVMIDVDFFKQINDTYGHLVGDRVLKFLAETVRDKCRNPDYVFRWGGDEFSVLLPQTDEQGACTWAERCCAVLTDTEFSSGPYTLRITASFGVAQRHKEMQNPEQLFHLADQALLAAKRAGRQRVVTAWGGCLSQPTGIASASSELLPNSTAIA
jgi:two-component system, cell cycle response regulator